MEVLTAFAFEIGRIPALRLEPSSLRIPWNRRAILPVGVPEDRWLARRRAGLGLDRQVQEGSLTYAA